MIINYAKKDNGYTGFILTMPILEKFEFKYGHFNMGPNGRSAALTRLTRLGGNARRIAGRTGVGHLGNYIEINEHNYKAYLAQTRHWLKACTFVRVSLTSSVSERW